MKSISNDVTPDVLILHIGCNNIGNKQLTENESNINVKKRR